MVSDDAKHEEPAAGAAGTGSENAWLAVWDGELPPTPTPEMLGLRAFGRWKESTLRRDHERLTGLTLLRALWQAREEAFVRGVRRRGPQEHHVMVVRIRYRDAYGVCAAAHCAWHGPPRGDDQQARADASAHVAAQQR